MKIEILYKDNTFEEKIKDLDIPKEIEFLKKQADDFYILAFYAVGNNRDTAKAMSSFLINLKLILEESKYFLLIDEISEYFNKTLYPKFNIFERNLRKVIYILSFTKNEDNLDEIAHKIEGLDFGEIYEVLFTSKDLQKEARTITGQNLSKKDIIRKIESIEEKTVWSDAFEGQYTYIPENMFLIKNHRNDIMHAHNFSYEKFCEMERLITRANTELDSIYSSFIGNKLVFNTDRLAQAILKILEAVRTVATAGAVLVLEQMAKYISEVKNDVPKPGNDTLKLENKEENQSDDNEGNDENGRDD